MRQHIAPYLPASATCEDPRWTAHYERLINSMVLFGVKLKIIAKYTGASSRTISQRHKDLIQKTAAQGRIPNSEPKSFTIPKDRVNAEEVLHYSLFASCYNRIESGISEVLNRGWLLVAAYETYLQMTEGMISKLGPGSAAYRLNINKAFGLTTYLSGTKELALKRCNQCGIEHLYLTSAEPEHQECPMCRIARLSRDSHPAITHDVELAKQSTK